MIPGKYKNTYRVNSIRLPNYDYSQNGYYFVTICTKNRQEYFGKIQNGIMCLYRTGSIILQFWQNISTLHPHIFIDDAYIVMPNHIHGIVVIDHGDAKNYYECISCQKFYAFKHDGNKQTRGRDVALQRLYTIDDNLQNMSRISPKRASLSSIIRSYKSACSKEINRLYQTYNISSPFAWQNRFYEHIIRDEKAYRAIQTYIYNNPAKWQYDRDNIW